MHIALKPTDISKIPLITQNVFHSGSLLNCAKYTRFIKPDINSHMPIINVLHTNKQSCIKESSIHFKE